MGYWEQKEKQIKEFYNKSREYHALFENCAFESMTQEEIDKFYPNDKDYGKLSKIERRTMHYMNLCGLYKYFKLEIK